MSFDLDKFTAEPSVELLNLGKKTDLLNLAKHYKLSEASAYQAPDPPPIGLFLTQHRNKSLK